MSDSPAVVDAARSADRPPRDNLVRAMPGGVAVQRPVDASRSVDGTEPSDNANGMPTLVGHFSTFNDWYEVDSYFEGHFLERIAPGAFKKTMREQQPIVLYNHGYDAVCGEKPLGVPDVLREDETGPYYEVPLFDASYVRDLVPALDANALGSSFRFSVMREDFVKEPGTSDHNPAGIPERTIKEARVPEFGPVSFPANSAATAGLRSATGMRSMTDEYLVAKMTNQPEGLRSILAYLEQRDQRTHLEAAPQEGTADTEADAATGGTAEEQDDATAGDEARAGKNTEEEPPAKATAPPKDKTDTAEPERSSTPLYAGPQDAAPGSPTPLYGTSTRREWEL